MQVIPDIKQISSTQILYLLPYLAAFDVISGAAIALRSAFINDLLKVKYNVSFTHLKSQIFLEHLTWTIND